MLPRMNEYWMEETSALCSYARSYIDKLPLLSVRPSQFPLLILSLCRPSETPPMSPSVKEIEISNADAESICTVHQ